MKTIAILTTSYPDINPGSEAAGAFVADFAEELASHADVTVVAPSLDSKNEVHGNNLRIRRFLVPRIPLSLLSPANPLHWPFILKTIYAGQQATLRLAEEKQLDHILALWALPSGHWAKIVGGKFGIPYSIWALGSDIWTLGTLPLVRQVLRSVLRKSRHCFADGYQLADDVTGISGRPCGFLPSSRQLLLDKEEKKEISAKPPYKLAYLGRWHQNKGTDLLMESLNLLSDRDWQRIYEVRIFGGGPLEYLVLSAGKKLQQMGRPVKIGGYLNQLEATELYLWADYVLLPSRIESIPVVFSDAMQTQCPVVSMPVGDLPRLVENYGVGVVAKNVTPHAFAAALRRAFEQGPSSYAKGLGAAKHDFDVASAARQFLQFVDPDFYDARDPNHFRLK